MTGRRAFGAALVAVVLALLCGGGPAAAGQTYYSRSIAWWGADHPDIVGPAELVLDLRCQTTAGPDWIQPPTTCQPGQDAAHAVLARVVSDLDPPAVEGVRLAYLRNDPRGLPWWQNTGTRTTAQVSAADLQGLDVTMLVDVHVAGGYAWGPWAATSELGTWTYALLMSGDCWSGGACAVEYLTGNALADEAAPAPTTTAAPTTTEDRPPVTSSPPTTTSGPPPQTSVATVVALDGEQMTVVGVGLALVVFLLAAVLAAQLRRP